MNVEFTRLTEGFREWLTIIGYEESSIQNQPRIISKYLSFMENQSISTLQEITTGHTKVWYESEKRRKSKQTGELLKNSTLNGIIRTLRLFSRYTEETAQGVLSLTIPYEPHEQPQREILTQKEVQALYNAADETILGLRDRAILSVYYGCGLRSKEGRFLELKDLVLDRKLLYVRKGKKYRERYVPFVKSQQTDFLLYLKECRPQLMQESTENWFLLNNKGKQVTASFLLERIKKLTKRAEIQKEIGLHTLRHSIATHLLQSGMKLETISQFLGHKNLNSTQTYTHVKMNHENL